ncbi:non-muscle cofilin 1-like [Etheostoma spectabile]|uniref:ADF-H domain-containing protein n=1 Tax=Etheostoma spectabile TaxID=54343 RepID=A0A5J5CTH4_9PERO|nr:destrin [Etheostoma spectabile]XP_034753437.1 non-muscle cofilin 1-like [Etheostoma cragini]KAA8583966.1 hypothetical protein FQN60_015174 [Etheostoma spectabile]
MTSGVKVADEVKDIYNLMKVVKTDADEKERIRLVILKIDGDIQVEKLYRAKDLDGIDDFFKFVMSLLPENECRYYLYDCHFVNQESKKEELVFMTWCPDNAQIKARMTYSSSKSALSKVFVGIKHDMQLNDPGENNRECFAEKLEKGGKKVLSLEGCSLRG